MNAWEVSALIEAIVRIISGAASDAASIWEGCGGGGDMDVFERAADAILALIGEKDPPV